MEQMWSREEIRCWTCISMHVGKLEGGKGAGEEGTEARHGGGSRWGTLHERGRA